MCSAVLLREAVLEHIFWSPCKLPREHTKSPGCVFLHLRSKGRAGAVRGLSLKTFHTALGQIEDRSESANTLARATERARKCLLRPTAPACAPAGSPCRRIEARRTAELKRLTALLALLLLQISICSCKPARKLFDHRSGAAAKETRGTVEAIQTSAAEQRSPTSA